MWASRRNGGSRTPSTIGGVTVPRLTCAERGAGGDAAMKYYDDHAVAAGVDASRRVAWARFYKAQAQVATLLGHNHLLLRKLVRLCVAIMRSETLDVLEPDGELRCEARRMLVTLRLNPRGRGLVDAAEREPWQG